MIEIRSDLQWSNLKAAIRAAEAASMDDYVAFDVVVQSVHDVTEMKMGIAITVETEKSK